MTDNLAAIRQTFFQECEEQLAELEAGLIAIGDGMAEADTVNAVFRSVHSIKGGAGAFQFGDLVSFAHGFESVLDDLRADRLQARPEVVRLMLRASDTLADLVRAARDGAAPGTAWQSLLRELDGVIQRPDPGGAAPDDAGDDFGFTPLAVRIPFGDDAPDSDGHGLVVVFRPRRSLFANAND
ncbi:MAG TPA: Hpt domain-containing protein, partial [Paracoccus sp. (in: a-proteobacteria)]|nr:Hpt domain-containing protein [Paracoccus sp. (in: a-proteobacteria)]